MMEGQIAARYSRALFRLAATREELEKRENDLGIVVEALEKLPKLRYFLSAPQITREEKNQALEKSLRGKVDQKFLYFLKFLLEKRRINHLPEIAQEYHRLVTQHLGILEANLITAVPVEESYKQRLQKKLESSFQKKINLKEKIDPHILGGVMLVLANQVIDWSVRNKIARLKEKLLAI